MVYKNKVTGEYKIAASCKSDKWEEVYKGTYEGEQMRLNELNGDFDAPIKTANKMRPAPEPEEKEKPKRTRRTKKTEE